MEFKPYAFTLDKNATPNQTFMHLTKERVLEAKLFGIKRIVKMSTHKSIVIYDYNGLTYVTERLLLP